MKKKLIVLPVLILLFTGCGQKEEQTSYESVGAIAADLNSKGVECWGFEEIDKIIAAQAGRCTVGGPDGESLELATFNNDKSKKTYIELGAVNGQIDVVGDNWLVGTSDRDTAEQIHKALGGELVIPE